MKYSRGKNLCLKDKKSIFIDNTVKIGNNVTIYENNRICGNTEIGDGVTILPGCFIKDSVIEECAQITSSHIESAFVGKNCAVGPFSRLRPGAIIKQNAKIGNFVEIKNSTIGENSKVSHLAYVGDADVGKDCNIGCGAIFVNYNGKSKSRTKVGDNCFIGSNCNLIAPLEVESNSYVCAGTTVTENVNENDFVIGRARQEVKKDRARNYLKNYLGD